MDSPLFLPGIRGAQEGYSDSRSSIGPISTRSADSPFEPRRTDRRRVAPEGSVTARTADIAPALIPRPPLTRSSRFSSTPDTPETTPAASVPPPVGRRPSPLLPALSFFPLSRPSTLRFPHGLLPTIATVEVTDV